MLQYGFVVVGADLALLYDHINKRQLSLSRIKMRELKSHRCAVLAKEVSNELPSSVKSPVFEYEQKGYSLEPKQSAFYMLDSLTKKHVIPVYIPDAHEVKDLADVLSDKERAVYQSLVDYLRLNYVHPETRKPASFFLREEDPISANELELSDEEIVQLFGRLPTLTETVNIVDGEHQFIPDNMGKLA